MSTDKLSHMVLIQSQTILYHLGFVVQCYNTEHCDILGHSSLTPIYLYIHKMNFDILRAWNSYPQLEVNHDVEWRSLNYAFCYDVCWFFNTTSLDKQKIFCLIELNIFILDDTVQCIHLAIILFNSNPTRRVWVCPCNILWKLAMWLC